MRRKWISPFDLLESLMWVNKQQINTEKPEESGKSEMRLVREAVENGTGDPVVIANEALIQRDFPPGREWQLQERQVYSGRWLSKSVRPQCLMLMRSKIRKVFSEMWLGDEELEVDLGELVNMLGRYQIGCRD